MSRRVVIGILILLILSVLGGIAALIISQLGAPEEDPAQILQPTPFPETEDPTADSDNDGLVNADEKIWGTNSSNPDSDSDGFLDGQEVQKNHNPTIASPNDKLPLGFKPKQNINPLEPSGSSIKSFESFFSDSVDVTGGSKNLTQEYDRKVSNKDKSPLTLSQFVQAQPITTSLPKLNDSAIIAEQDIPLALAQYISVAGNIDPISDKARVSLAINDFLQNQNVTGFGTLADRVAVYQKSIQALRVPSTAVQYHKVLVGYCELLAGTFRQIAGYQNDQIKALVALRQLDAIDRQYYPIITQERSRLLNLPR